MTHQPFDGYCRAHIFAPLGMRDPGFLPNAKHAARSAPTTAGRPGMRRGQVHDPLASSMQGVAGNAGLGLSTTRAKRVLSASRSWRPPRRPYAPEPWRGLGWALTSPLVTNRDRLPPIGAVEHTGYTGTAIWVDFVTRRFAVVLTNRVHPNDQGDARPLRAQIVAAIAS
ncbi:beta-lactamase family protein [Paraburkholderia aromaticivorans]|uniref:beta-lactamase family protein n=1 Tax=Paraburkholderia aromaticivorans TaxID=2026199 RepID=UPI001F107DFE|nr:beta-lactamase family protein [Paraburkholderia aromaticivorans]